MIKIKNASIYCVILLILVFTGILLSLKVEENHYVEKGILNVDQQNLLELVSLEGEWEFYWEQHVLNVDELDKQYIQVPSKWEEPHGYSTYRLVIENVIPNEYYGLKIHSITSAYDLFVDTKLVASNGSTGTSREETKPFDSPKTVMFSASSDSIELIFHVSNYDYRYGGITLDILFGTAEQLQNQSRLGLGLQMLLFGCLIMSGFYHLVVYTYRRNNSTAMFFSAACILMGLRILVTEHKFILEVVPIISWELMSKLEFITFYLGAPAFVWVLCTLYPKHMSKVIGKLFTYVSVGVVLFVIISPVAIASYTVNPYQVLVIIIITYMMISLIRALKDKEEGSFIITIFSAFVGFTAINDILLTNNLIQSVPLSAFGFVLFILAQSYIIALHSGNAFTKMEKVTAELAELNQTLEIKVSERTKSLEKSRDHLNRLNEKLKELSYNDQLTKIPNRRYLDEKFEAEWKLAQEKKFKVAVLYMDIDKFKQFNDTYGHEAGDRCLIEVAATLRQAISPYNGYVARLGGEEYIAVLSNTNYEQVKIVAEKCLVAIRNLQIPHESSTVTDSVTISIGTAFTLPNDKFSSTKELIMEADKNLYKAKENGRNQVVLME